MLMLKIGWGDITFGLFPRKGAEIFKVLSSI